MVHFMHWNYRRWRCYIYHHREHRRSQRKYERNQLEISGLAGNDKARKL